MTYVNYQVCVCGVQNALHDTKCWGCKQELHELPVVLNVVVEPPISPGGIKHDAGKPPLDLLPGEALEEIARVLAFGANKYNAHNWRGGFAWSRLMGACLRHLFSYSRGIRKDDESGLSHLAHAGAMILFLLAHESSGLGTDDLYKKEA